MPRHNAKGETEFTERVGNTYTGQHAVDGTMNVVINDGSTYTGYLHRSGAVNAVVTTSKAATRHPNGSMYVILQADGVGYTPVGG